MLQAEGQAQSPDVPGETFPPGLEEPAEPDIAAGDSAPEVERGKPGLDADAEGEKARLQGNEVQRPQELHFTIQRAGDVGIGLNVDAHKAAAFVDDIGDGGVKDWNESHPDAQLMLNDHIVAVNGVREDVVLILDELRSNHTWKLVVHRPTRLDLDLDLATSASLGVSLKYSPHGRTLLITDVCETGAVSCWNQRHQGKTVKIGDRILEINGMGGKAEDMLQNVPLVASLHVVVLCYP